MILPYKMKNKVNSQTLHDLIIKLRKEKNNKCEKISSKLFCSFWEITNIIRVNITSSGYNNLIKDDWYDIQVSSIIHLFEKLKLYDENRKDVCFAFCYMILLNKMKDLVKKYSFNKYIHDGVYDITTSKHVNNLSANHRGSNSRIIDNIKPLRRFDACERQREQ